MKNKNIKRKIAIIMIILISSINIWRVNANAMVIVKDGGVNYCSHVQDYGWLDYADTAEVSGTVGESKRMEAISISLKDDIDGGIAYVTHIQDDGWIDSSINGDVSGTVGESKRLEAIGMSLIDDAATKYDIYYRVHVQDIGWMAWAKNGQYAGTTGYSLQVEAIQIVILNNYIEFTDVWGSGDQPTFMEQ